ncbi:MAG: M28 family peptidase [Anaerolineae bacterium]
MSRNDPDPQQAISHIRHLSIGIGGRGSCTQAERQAAEYVAEQMHLLGVRDVRLEPYIGAPSTYRPYALAFTAALLGTIGVWLVDSWWMMAIAAVLSALGAWGMLAETDFATNWMRRLLPKGRSQNAIGIMPPSGSVRHRVVLCAHLDTHRTPIFYSSKAWHTLFGFLVAAAFVSMGIGAVAYSLGTIWGWQWVRWLGLATAAMELFALVMCLHADLTPFSPGANDNASGVGVILGLAERLRKEPLNHTEVWLAFTGCEEAAAYGMVSFLNRHTAELGNDAFYVIIDQVGLGRVMVLTADGLIIKRKTHPRALELARRAAAALPERAIGEHVGIAYTDAAVATKRGLIALSIDALPPPGASDVMHWHQTSDTVAHIDPQSLADAHAFVWQILQEIDRS